MTVTKRKILSNPRRVVVKPYAGKRRNVSAKRKMTPKQIRYFGTKRQRAALKKKRSASSSRGHRPRTVATNPALVVTLGPVVNPRRKRSSNMPAKAKRRSASRKRAVSQNRRRVARNPHRPRTRVRTKVKTVIRYRAKAKRNRKRNPTRVVVVQRRSNRRRSRNPSLFGASLGSKQSLVILGGGFTGLVAAKFIPTLLPTSITTGSGFGASNGGRFVLTLGSAILAAWAAGKFVGGAFGDGVLFGGLIQAGSVALNAFLPSVYSSLGIGLGDLLPGRFTVPQNPIRAGMQPRALPAAQPVQGGQARVTMNGLARAYGAAF